MRRGETSFSCAEKNGILFLRRYNSMTENEMIDSLQEVWESMTTDKSRAAYSEILWLLDSMVHYLRHDLGIEYIHEPLSAGAGEFDF